MGRPPREKFQDFLQQKSSRKAESRSTISAADTNLSVLIQVSSKIGVIESLIEKVDKIILGGGMIFTFFKARGLGVGSSLVEEDKLNLAKQLEEAAKKKGRALCSPYPLACTLKCKAGLDGNRSSSAQVWSSSCPQT